MKVTDLPAPSRTAKPYLTSLDPWQIEAINHLREQHGIDGDALIRAGVTLALAMSLTAREDPPCSGTRASD